VANGLLNNLIAYWGLDEASGNALDKHSGARTLTANNAPGAAAGKVYGTARSLNGSSQYFTRASEAALQAGDIDFTIAAWVYLGANTNSGIVAKLINGVAADYLLFYNQNDSTPNNRFFWTVFDGAGQWYDCPATTFGQPTLNTWNLVIAWHDATNNQLGISINAGTANTVTHTAGIAVNGTPFALGGIPNTPDYPLNGRIGPVAVWKSAAGAGGALTSTQRTALYNAGAGLAYASFDNGTSSTAALTATDITTGTPALGTPSISSIAALTASGITTGAPVVGTPSASGSAALVATGMATGAPSLGSPAIQQRHALAATGVATGAPVLGSPYALPHEGVTGAGVLVRSSANGRYFARGSATGPIVPLAGFHTWYELQDGGLTYPPSPFDYVGFLDYVDARGGNFHKLWLAGETAKGWSDTIEPVFSPHPWVRTGPGNAADGRPKFDLTQFNQAYFNRLRERAILAGNRGHYVGVMLFEGWSITDKGLGNNPFIYHPFNGPNNVNGIDGDINNDNNGEETRNLANTAIVALQQAYIEEVVKALGDLDNLVWEISNEENSTAQTVAWTNHWIDFIHTYEAGRAKRHPVGFTTLFPGGNDSDLNASAADWISPNNGSSLTPGTATGGKVILFDTDHVVGLTTDHKWVWQSFTRGYNPVFMDPYDGALYGADTRAAAPEERIRRNLGLVLDYAARLDLSLATPQNSLASTGYCLAQTTGVARLLVYQSGSGAFTVNLTGLAGTFAVEWARSAATTPVAQAGSNVAGGAVRTLTPPWAGEDAVAFLEKIGSDLVAASLTAGAPTVGAPAVGQRHALAAAGVTAAAPAPGSPGISQTHVLGAVGLATGAPAVGAPAASHVHVLVAGIVTAAGPTVGSPAVGQRHALIATPVATGAPTLSAPAVAHVHVLVAPGLTGSSPTVGAPVIGQRHALAAIGIATGAPAVGAPGMGGEAALSAGDVTLGAPTLGTPAIKQVHVLVADGLLSGAPTLGTPAIKPAIRRTDAGDARHQAGARPGCRRLVVRRTDAGDARHRQHGRPGGAGDRRGRAGRWSAGH
jgi:hypothetical protein